MAGHKVEDGGVFSFPAGKRLQKFLFGARRVKRTAGDVHVIVEPFRNLKLGIFDVKRGFITFGVNKEDLTLWHNLAAYESLDGRVTLAETSYNEATQKLEINDLASAEIPVSSLKSLQAAAVSDNLNWLLLSSKTRGGVWNLSTGERKVYVRGFRGGILDNSGGAIGDFPAQDDAPRALVLMKPNANEVGLFRELPAKGARQFGRYVLTLGPANEKKEGQKDAPAPADGPDELSLTREVRFELKDFIQDKVIWSREFPKEAPQYSFDEFSGRLVFYWRLASDAGKARLKESPELQAKADALGNKRDDYLVEVVDAYAAKTVGTLLLETGQGSFDVGGGISEGNWLVLNDSEGRVLVYAIKEGELRHRFFGSNAAINPSRNLIAVENFPGEVTLYDLDSGDRRANLLINGAAAFARFNLEGSRLLIFSDAQTAYAFDLNKLAPKAAAAAK
jgi:hypothetical protein